MTTRATQKTTKHALQRKIAWTNGVLNERTKCFGNLRNDQDAYEIAEAQQKFRRKGGRTCNAQKEASKRSKRMNIRSRNVNGKTVGAFLITALKITAHAHQIEQFTDLRIGGQSIQ